VDLIVTELAVMEPSLGGLILRELAPGVDIETVQRATDTRLLFGASLQRRAERWRGPAVDKTRIRLRFG